MEVGELERCDEDSLRERSGREGEEGEELLEGRCAVLTSPGIGRIIAVLEYLEMRCEEEAFRLIAAK